MILWTPKRLCWVLRRLWYFHNKQRLVVEVITATVEEELAERNFGVHKMKPLLLHWHTVQFFNSHGQTRWLLEWTHRVNSRSELTATERRRRSGSRRRHRAVVVLKRRLDCRDGNLSEVNDSILKWLSMQQSFSCTFQMWFCDLWSDWKKYTRVYIYIYIYMSLLIL